MALGLLHSTLSSLTDGLRTSVAFQQDEVQQLREELEREQSFAREHAEVNAALLKSQASQCAPTRCTHVTFGCASRFLYCIFSLLLCVCARTGRPVVTSASS